MTFQRRPPERPLLRRDAAGGERTAPDWETLTERLIREAQEEGAFDDLPGHGQPLALEADQYAGDMAMANHVLRNAGAVPPWIEADKEARRALELIETVLDRAARSPSIARPSLERELERNADTHDRAVFRLESLAPTPHQQRHRVDRTELRRRLANALERAVDAA